MRLLLQFDQKYKDHQNVIITTSNGLQFFPNSAELHICLGISLMQLGDFEKALNSFSKARHNPQASIYIQQCRDALDHKPK